MALAARCPECGTSFRIVPDQLKISEGWVRCGQCEHIFNAYETQFDASDEQLAFACEVPQETSLIPPQAALPPLEDDDQSEIDIREIELDDFSPSRVDEFFTLGDFSSGTFPPNLAGQADSKPPFPDTLLAEFQLASCFPEYEPSAPPPEKSAPRRQATFSDSLLAEFEVGWEDSAFASLAQNGAEHHTNPKKLFSPSASQSAENLTDWFKAQIESNAALSEVSTNDLQIDQPTTMPEQAQKESEPIPLTEGKVFSPAINIEPPVGLSTSEAPTLETVEERKTQLFPSRANEGAFHNISDNKPYQRVSPDIAINKRPETASSGIPRQPRTSEVAGTSDHRHSSPLMSITLDDDDSPLPAAPTLSEEKLETYTTLAEKIDEHQSTTPLNSASPASSSASGFGASVFTSSRPTSSSLSSMMPPASMAASSGTYNKTYSSEEYTPVPTAKNRMSKSPGATSQTEAEDIQHLSFIRSSSQDIFWHKSWVRFCLSIFLLLLIALLLLQITIAFRDKLAAQQPSLRPMLISLCEPLNCTVNYPMDIQNIAIEHSEFQTLGNSHYRLIMTLRNRAPGPVAPPWIELTLPDSAGQTVIRKVLSPEELGVTIPYLKPQEEVFIEQPLLVNAADIQGYNIDLFYP